FAVTLAATGASPAALILNGIVARVRGLAVSNTGGDGIILRGDADWVESCHVGPNSGDGIRIEGTNGSVTGTTIVSSADGIVVAATTAHNAYIDNWLARNGGNGLTILGIVENVLANTGTCNAGLLVDYGNDGPSSPDAPALQGAPNPPELTSAARDAET